MKIPLHTPFTLNGEMPSKKNNWKRSITGQVYVPAEIKDEVDAFLWQLPLIRRERDIQTPITASVRLTAIFYTCKRRDLDNMLTTLQDILQAGKVIKNDVQVVSIHTEKIEVDAHPHVTVSIEELFSSR